MSPHHRQRGAALLVSLIMLGLITVMVLSTMGLSTSNFRAVGNMQFRDQAAAAASAAIEQVITSPFTDDPTGEAINIDLDNDDKVDYEVVFAKPVCVGQKSVPSTTSAPSSLSLGSAFVVTTAAYYLTTWDLDASVTDIASGANVRVHQGVRVRLTKPQYEAVCV